MAFKRSSVRSRPAPLIIPTLSEDLTINSPDNNLDQSLLKKDILLKGIDSEIRYIIDSSRRTGLTNWAVLGAMATISWLIFSEIKNYTHVYDFVELSIVILSVAVDSLFVAFKLLSPPTVKSNFHLRFLPDSWITNSRPSIVLGGFRSIYIIYLTSVFIYPLGIIPAVIIFINYGVFLLIVLLLLVVSFSNLQTPLISKYADWQIKFWKFLKPLNIILSIEVFVWLILIQVDHFENNEFKLAGLITALIYLTYILTQKSESNPFLSTLMETRRNLLLDKIDVPSAQNTVDITFFGLKLGDLFQKDIQEILGNLNDSDSIYLGLISKYEYMVEQMIPTNTPKEYEALKAIVLTCERDYETLNELDRKLSVKLEKFSRKENTILLNHPQFGSEFVPINKILEDQLNINQANHSALKSKIEEYKSALKEADNGD